MNEDNTKAGVDQSIELTLGATTNPDRFDVVTNPMRGRSADADVLPVSKAMTGEGLSYREGGANKETKQSGK